MVRGDLRAVASHADKANEALLSGFDRGVGANARNLTGAKRAQLQTG